MCEFSRICIYIKKTMNIKEKGEDMDDLFLLQRLQTTLNYYKGNPLHIVMISYIWNIIECLSFVLQTYRLENETFSMLEL